MERQIIQSWQKNAAAWTATVRAGKIESRRVATDDAIIAAVSGSGVRRVLDVGCGEGWLARALADRSIDVVGVDGSAELVGEAQALGGGTFHVFSYDEIVSAPELLAGPFDGIVCNFALLAKTILPLLGALRSLLAEDGSLFIQTVHPFAACGDGAYQDGWRTETFAGFGEDFREPMPWYFRTTGSWAGVLQQAGFRIAECLEPVHPETGRPLSLLLVCMQTAR